MKKLKEATEFIEGLIEFGEKVKELRTGFVTNGDRPTEIESEREMLKRKLQNIKNEIEQLRHENTQLKKSIQEQKKLLGEVRKE